MLKIILKQLAYLHPVILKQLKPVTYIYIIGQK